MYSVGGSNRGICPQLLSNFYLQCLGKEFIIGFSTPIFQPVKWESNLLPPFYFKKVRWE